MSCCRRTTWRTTTTCSASPTPGSSCAGHCRCARGVRHRRARPVRYSARRHPRRAPSHQSQRARPGAAAWVQGRVALRRARVVDRQAGGLHLGHPRGGARQRQHAQDGGDQLPVRAQEAAAQAAGARADQGDGVPAAALPPCWCRRWHSRPTAASASVKPDRLNRVRRK